MILNVFIFIAAFMLFFRALFLLGGVTVMWKLYKTLAKQYSVKTHGKIVDVIGQNCPGNSDIKEYQVKVEYKIKSDEETHYEVLPYDIILPKKSTVNHTKKPQVGEVITIWYDPNDICQIITLPRQYMIEFIYKMFIPGCFFLLASILGVCSIFN